MSCLKELGRSYFTLAGLRLLVSILACFLLYFLLSSSFTFLPACGDAHPSWLCDAQNLHVTVEVPYLRASHAYTPNNPELGEQPSRKKYTSLQAVPSLRPSPICHQCRPRLDYLLRQRASLWRELHQVRYRMG